MFVTIKGKQNLQNHLTCNVFIYSVYLEHIQTSTCKGAAMKLQQYTSTLTFTIGYTTFHVSNMILERLQRSIPLHSHSKNSYELHYIASGYGQAVISQAPYSITPNTLFITGPFIEHQQIPNPADPMCEYCIYLKIETSPQLKKTVRPGQDDMVLAEVFTNTSFWFGQDTQDIHSLMKSLFSEMEHEYTGYLIEARSCLQQIITRIVRNYEYKKKAGTQPMPSDLLNNPYLVIEECFLYEYQTLTLDQLSSRLGLSSRQTERLLMAHYSKTFLQKKTESRMSAASILLNDRSKSITSVSQELGYSSIEHFSAAFKRFYGQSPSSYRKLH